MLGLRQGRRPIAECLEAASLPAVPYGALLLQRVPAHRLEGAQVGVRAARRVPSLQQGWQAQPGRQEPCSESPRVAQRRRWGWRGRLGLQEAAHSDRV
jgi:hypothetical protein